MQSKHYKPKTMDEIGRLQVPKYIRKMLKVNEGDNFELIFDAKQKVISFKYIKERGAN